MPTVSVVLPVWNPDPDLLRAAVQSVLDQTHHDLELIVVEDPGPTSAEAVLQELDDPRIRHHRNQRKGTLGAARNLGLQLARSEVVAIHDADDTSTPDRLEMQLARMTAAPELAVLGGQLDVVNDQGRHLGYRAYPVQHDAIMSAMRRINAVAHPTVMLRKAAVLDAGGYSEDPDLACEDYELWSRLAAAGCRFESLPGALVRYRVHQGGMKSRLLRATLRDTLLVKKRYWASKMNLGDRLRMLGERLLLWLPPRLVMGLFLRLSLKKRLQPQPG